VEDTVNDELMASLIVVATVVTMPRLPLACVAGLTSSSFSLETADTAAKDIALSPAAATGIAALELALFGIVLLDVQFGFEVKDCWMALESDAQKGGRAPRK
jgi:hypothetical protein